MHSEAFQFLLPPFLICLILTGIHAYLGIHVLERGVIFVDLALAQIAMLGTTIAFLIDLPHDGIGAYFISLGFTLVGAALFSLSRKMEERRIPQEAFIGVCYAFASALIILLIDKSSHGAEHVKEMLVGNILWVSVTDVYSTLGLYIIIAAIHFLYRKQFLLISSDPEKAKAKGMNLVLWDLLFYGTFGMVITSSVKIAGVLLVFSFLVVPSIIGMVFANKLSHRLLIGWTSGFAVSLCGVVASYHFDLPTGASLVVLFGILLILVLFTSKLLPKFRHL